MEPTTLEKTLTSYLARISRMEIATLALVKTLSDSNNLPSNFGATFSADLAEYSGTLSKEASLLRSSLERHGAEWIPLMNALSRPAK